MIITPINTMRVVFSFNFVFLSQSKQNNQLIQDYKDLPCEAEEKKGGCSHHCQRFLFSSLMKMAMVELSPKDTNLRSYPRIS